CRRAPRPDPAPPPDPRARPCRPAAPLLLILHVTAIRGVFPHKKGLESRLNLLLKDRTLLIGLHGVERVPYADGKAAVRIIDVLREPPTPEAWHLFSPHCCSIGLLILLPGACSQFAPSDPHNHS